MAPVEWSTRIRPHHKINNREIAAMFRFRSALPLLALLCAASASLAQGPATFPLRCQSDNGFLQILSDR